MAIQNSAQYAHTANQHAFLEDALKELQSRVMHDADEEYRRDLEVASLQGQIADLIAEMQNWQEHLQN